MRCGEFVGTQTDPPDRGTTNSMTGDQLCCSRHCTHCTVLHGGGCPALPARDLPAAHWRLRAAGGRCEVGQGWGFSGGTWDKALDPKPGAHAAEGKLETVGPEKYHVIRQDEQPAAGLAMRMHALQVQGGAQTGSSPQSIAAGCHGSRLDPGMTGIAAGSGFGHFSPRLQVLACTASRTWPCMQMARRRSLLRSSPQIRVLPASTPPRAP